MLNYNINLNNHKIRLFKWIGEYQNYLLFPNKLNNKKIKLMKMNE